MKKQISVILEVESDDPIMISDEFIKGDLITELNCASNYYAVKSIGTIETTQKPPLGLKPKYIHEAERKQEICDAMMRYAEAKMPVPVEWVSELNGLLNSNAYHNLTMAE